MEIFERIKYLRKSILKLSQEDFAKKIGLSRSNVGNIEVGRINVTERVIGDIITQYNVNEEWLRNGTGEMFIEPDTFSLDEYVKSKGATELEIELIKGYLDFPAELRNQLMNLFKNSIFKDMKTNEISATTEETFEEKKKRELEAYALELEAEAKGEISSALEKHEGA
ncbi:helix-turn-helix transcriptional regulator [Clostridium sp.]|uniref:helix-turn-helix domain-containing protein n=1 Tax=Clostridium sp. TaxID=1506 RepID=UPI002914B2C9|nr:helix-turn-helix transcriptional regulator [Clostridium sp.]MDU4476633.1 helix-turn-helix transcriptional regulator [Clostridium sp.]